MAVFAGLDLNRNSNQIVTVSTIAYRSELLIKARFMSNPNLNVFVRHLVEGTKLTLNALEGTKLDEDSPPS